MKPENIEDIYKLSSTQQGLLFHTLYAPDSGIYCDQYSITLRGDLNCLAFKQAWQQVAKRHTVLRTSFFWEEVDEPMQVVHRQVDLPLEQHDWRGIEPVEQQQRLKTFLITDQKRGFELFQAPLMRLFLIQIAENVYQFIWSNHHLILDGWSRFVLFKEVLELYQSLCTSKNLYLKPAFPYRKYIAWLRQQDLSQAETFWCQALQGVTAPTPLVVDKLVSRTASAEEYSEQQIELSLANTEQLKSLARQHQLTFNTLVQGAWALLLSRYSGEQDVVFGANTSGRPVNLPGVELASGLFVNTLPVRVRLNAEDSLVPWLKKLQAEQAQARQYEYSPLGQVQRWSEIPKGVPLFNSLIAFENYPVDSALRQGNKNLEICNVSVVNRTNYPLLVIVVPGSELLLKIIYDCQLFDDATIIRMLGHLQTLLKGMIANPEQPLKDLPLLTASERHLSLVEWNNTQTEYPQNLCIHQLFEAQVKRSPDAIAVIFADQQLTYQELNTRANQLAHHLQKLGVGPEVQVGICTERSLEMVIGLLGILKAGGAYVPIDPSYPQSRQAFMLEDAQIRILLTQKDLVTKLPEHQAQIICLDTDWKAIAQESNTNLDHSHLIPDNLGYIIYTSGSTGQPKGVLVTHANVVRLLKATQSWFNFNEHDIWTLFHSYAFDFSVWELWGALSYGGRVVVVSYWVSRTPQAFCNLLCKERVTILNQTPSAFRQLMQEEELSGKSFDYNLRLVIFGGEALDIQSLTPWFERHKEHSPQLVNMYGITETTVHVTYRPLTLADQRMASGSLIGRPLLDLQVYVLDQHHSPVPIGVPGEMYVSGAGLARGYLNRPELTSQKFIPNPFSNKAGTRLYKTGDLVRYLPNGEIEYLGRIDHQVKIRGFRIELGEIEALLSQHPAVREAVVLIREGQHDNKYLVAYIVANQEQTPTNSELRNHLIQALPDYMLPSAFVLLEALPLTLNGKVDRQALLSLPEDVQPELTENFIAPRTPIEEVLAGIWTHALNLKQVGIYDNFFELGGHSLLATQVISQIRQAFQMDLPLRHLFESPTVAGLACDIEIAMKTEQVWKSIPIQQISREGDLPLSFAQQRLWFLHQLEPGSITYNGSNAVLLQGSLNVEALEKSIKEIVRRHEVLRTCFAVVEGRAVQRITSDLIVPLVIVDLKDLPETERQAEVQRLGQADAQQPFDLTQTPLLRLTLLWLDTEEHILLVTMHHIISDAWSAGVFTSEMLALYEAFSTERPSPLPELPIQYVDFAVWQQQWLQGEVLNTQLGYWKQQLAGAKTVLALPTDKPRSQPQTSAGSKHSFGISPSLSQPLRTLSQREGVTLFMTMLAAFNTLIYHYTNQEDILVGSPITNRNISEIEGLIGFFVNTLVLRTDLSNNPSFSELLRRVREVALGAYTHQDLPFEKLVGELQIERNSSHNPLFQVWFTLQNTSTPNVTNVPSLPNLNLSLFEINTTAKFDLALLLSETPEVISGGFEYKTDLFEASTIARMAEHFEILLDAVVTHPEVRLNKLREILNQVDKQQHLTMAQVYQNTVRQKLLNIKHKSNSKYQ